MAFSAECFRNCVRRNLNWKTWIGIGLFVIATFLVALFSWGLALPLAIAWAAGAFGAAIAGILGFCYLGCR